MLKKLTPEKITEILESGIDEFAKRGADQANVNVIARKAGVSIGVLYKYWTGKDDFFKACLRHALSTLEKAIAEAMQGNCPLLVRAERLIRAVQRSAKEQPNYTVLYHEITSGSCSRYAVDFAREIEGIFCKAYAVFIRQARQRGELRGDTDPRMLAYFFDNLLMMLQFSYCCDYYRERFQIFCGADIFADDEKVVAELLKFYRAAFGGDTVAVAPAPKS